MPTVMRRFAMAFSGVAIIAIGCSPTPTTPSEVAAPPPMGLTITAADVAFEPATLVAPAGVPLLVTFQNTDDGIPHSLRLLAPPAFQRTLLETEVLAGPAESTMAIPGLAPGPYRFDCSVHPNMTVDMQVG